MSTELKEDILILNKINIYKKYFIKSTIVSFIKYFFVCAIVRIISNVLWIYTFTFSFLTVKKMSMRYHSFKVFKTHYNFWKIFSIPDQYVPLYGHLILAAFNHTPPIRFLLVWYMCISGTIGTDFVINIIEYI